MLYPRQDKQAWKWTVLVLATFLPWVTTSRTARSEEAPKNKFWIFLVTGKATTGVSNEEIQNKQQAHLANFRRLAGEKLLLTAGPMVDPAKTLRGIVVVLADEERQIPDYFAPDPYVVEGFMKTEINRVVEMVGDMKVPSDATQLEQLRIVVWDRMTAEGKPAPNASALLSKHADYWNRMRDEGHVAVRCRFAEDASRFGVAILPAAGDEQVKKWLDEDPLVEQKVVQYQVMPQYLVKGAVQFSK